MRSGQGRTWPLAERPLKTGTGRKRLLANNANELPVEAGELETPDARLLTVSFLADFASRFSHPLESDL